MNGGSTLIEARTDHGGMARFIAPPGAFRLLLATAVAISHVSRFEIGHLSVLLFFYLSGYWTAKIWVTKFNAENIIKYYISRYLRIFPLFLIATIAGSILRQQPLRLVNFTLLGTATAGTDPTGVSWSLDIELQFYLLLPVIVAGLSSRWRTWTIALVALAGVAGWYLESHAGLHTVAKYLPVFTLGAATFLRAFKPSTGMASASLVAFVAMTGITMLTPFFIKSADKPFDLEVWSFFWLLPLIPYVARSLSVRSSPLDRHLGNLSYPFYLVHFISIALITQAFGSSLPAKGFALALAAAAALAIYWMVDRPIDAWRVRLTEAKPSP